MKRILYQSIKISVGVVVSIYLAQLVGLLFATTAGIVTMLSILDTRKQTYIVGLKRIIVSVIAILISTLLFLLGHNLYVLGIFLVIFIPLLILSKSTEGLTVSTVLVTHMYSLKTIGISVALNEIALVSIGVFIAFLVNTHMPHEEKKIKILQEDVEHIIRKILHKMELQLLNQCSIEEQESSLVELDKLLTSGLDLAIKFNNNAVLSDQSYYIKYFQMRRQQYLVLSHMEKHFEQIFITVDKAKPLSEFTHQLALSFAEGNNGEELLKKAKELQSYYKESELPKTREEFENRAVLYQYFSDLIYFIDIKSKFMKKVQK